MMYILSQILVTLSDLMCMISMLNKKKKNIVFFLMLSTILFAAHYMCLSGWTGAAVASVELIFLILLYILEIKEKTQYSVHLSIITMTATIVVSSITWVSWISLLPMFAMVVYLTGMIFKNVIIVKTCTFVRLLLNGVYMFLLKSYLGAGLTILILICTIVGIVDNYKAKNKTHETAEL